MRARIRLRLLKKTGTTDYLARPLAATKFEIRISKYETIIVAL